MINIINKEKCSGCHACAAACPKECISMERDEEGFLYPRVDKDKCINCQLCEKSCPIIEKNAHSLDVCAYAIKNRDDEIRMQSSSGGIFTAIATKVILDGGVVFGAAFDSSFNVHHICVESVEELSRLRGSKYVQSTIGNTYKQAKEMLDSERFVYFTGTPCQIEGLLKYLGREYENLLTSDIVCHGVPSPMVWQLYLRSKSDSCVKYASFRDKSEGWGNYSVVISFENSPEYKALASNDMYIKAFLSDLCLRPSCYSCAFKSKNRASDLTLADFWGIEKVLPELNDNKGTSLVLVHGKKGKKLLDDISEYIEIKEVDLDKALIYNPSATVSSSKPQKREEFIKNIRSEEFDKITEKYSKRTFIQKLKSKIKSIFK